MNKQAIKELSESLVNCVFVPALKATTKHGVIAEIADAFVNAGKVAPEHRDSVFASLAEREGKMSTGMQYGVAIPHAKTDVVSKLATLIALSPAGIDFDSIDKAPACVFVATLSPRADANSHIKFLAEVSRQLSNRLIREQLRTAKTKAEMITALGGGQE
ncbi:MAG: PTS sugar transporter subunit IIA [Kiritimatiellaeota bacterium]|nr:PTS sugar transporter subunit IIA [Kiritimatiellota bacterium]